MALVEVLGGAAEGRVERNAVAYHHGTEIGEDGALADREVDKVEGALRDKIVSLDWEPGMMVSLSEMMATLQCGRTPLRLALERLASRGLIVAVPRRGIMVAPITLEEYLETYEFAEGIADLAGRLAAQRITEPEIAELEAIFVQWQAASASGDIVLGGRVSTRFQETLLRSTRNRYLIQAGSRVALATERLILLGRIRARRPVGPDAMVEIGVLMENLRSRNPAGAGEALLAFARGGRERQMGHF